MKFSRRKGLLKVEDEPVVRIPSVPVVRPEESVSKGVQQAHIRVYDDHATIVNAPRAPSVAFKPLITPVKPAVVSPIKLPQKALEKPLMIGLKNYQSYLDKVRNQARIIWNVGVAPEKDKLSLAHFPSCLICNKVMMNQGFPLLIQTEFNANFPTKPVADILCEDCWKETIAKGGVIIIPAEETKEGINPIKPKKLLLINENTIPRIFGPGALDNKHVILMPVKSYNELVTEAGAEESLVEDIPKGWKTMQLKDILTNEQVEKAVKFLNDDNPRGLRRYLRSINLKKKGINPDFLAYNLIHHAMQESGQRDINDVIGALDAMIKGIESGEVPDSALEEVAAQANMKAPSRQHLVEGLKDMKEQLVAEAERKKR